MHLHVRKSMSGSRDPSSSCLKSERRMPPKTFCPRCKQAMRGRGTGYCVNPACRKVLKEKMLEQLSPKKGEPKDSKARPSRAGGSTTCHKRPAATAATEASDEEEAAAGSLSAASLPSMEGVEVETILEMETAASSSAGDLHREEASSQPKQHPGEAESAAANSDERAPPPSPAAQGNSTAAEPTSLQQEILASEGTNKRGEEPGRRRCSRSTKPRRRRRDPRVGSTRVKSSG